MCAPPPLDLPALRAEATRRLTRAHKKLSKAEARAAAAAAPASASASAAAAAALRLAAQLQTLVDGLAPLASHDDPRLPPLLALAASLGVSDGKRTPTPRRRLPYRTYESEGGAQIRVGRSARDNDLLSTDAAHRAADDWWLHAQGCPGSHVVVRAGSLPRGELSDEVARDAAVLAARHSKAAREGTVGVSLCRARQVSKPEGAPPGLVRLSGEVRTLAVEWKKERRRLERLEAQHAQTAAEA
ncbi:hypothetical protein AB1Y20_013330 [Prymnesium parvum]|uniref:NFACT RNA-binding domain-containing protein n=1 Tax=Prymnesium parvum TaxID=97485 RepID=A0AB34INX8_PRYPA